MDYEKKYKEALERAKEMIKAMTNIGGVAKVDDIQYLFPELKESEDERIRKEIINYIKNSTCQVDNETYKSWIAWLDKQGEQKSTDKIEPKFKVGDIITNGILIGEIDEIHEWGYHAYFGDHYADVPDVENWHKWTIQDAKANAGYEGNADKKELKKIEQKPTEWSEEDEDIIEWLIGYLEYRIMNATLTEEKNNCLNAISMLKSLKDRYTWKPSEEQMDNK